jgi:hypothetical protein
MRQPPEAGPGCKIKIRGNVGERLVQGLSERLSASFQGVTFLILLGKQLVIEHMFE